MQAKRGTSGDVSVPVLGLSRNRLHQQYERHLLPLRTIGLFHHLHSHLFYRSNAASPDDTIEATYTYTYDDADNLLTKVSPFEDNFIAEISTRWMNIDFESTLAVLTD